MPRYDGTGPTGEGPGTGGHRGYCKDGQLYGQKRQAQQKEVIPGELEKKSEPAPAPNTVESVVGTGLGPCGNGIPRGGGRGLGRGYHGGRQ